MTEKTGKKHTLESESKQAKTYPYRENNVWHIDADTRIDIPIRMTIKSSAPHTSKEPPAKPVSFFEKKFSV